MFGTTYKYGCNVICGLGFVVFLVSLHFQPGIYYGHIEGHFDLGPFESISNYSMVRIDARTNSAWHWKKPGSFSYDHAELMIEGKSYWIEFASLSCKGDQQERPFTEVLLSELLSYTPQRATASDEAVTRQIRILYDFILSIGNHTIPGPKHHPYNVEEMPGNFFVHFAPGWDFTLPISMGTVLAGIVLRFFAAPRPVIKTLPVWIALINFGIVVLGILFTYLEGPLGNLCNSLIPLSLITISAGPFVFLFDYYRRCVKNQSFQKDFLGFYLTFMLLMFPIYLGFLPR